MNRVDHLEDDIEPDALREAELMQARDLLEGLEGRTITAVRVEDTRITIETDDGVASYFYGFMGQDVPEA